MNGTSEARRVTMHVGNGMAGEVTVSNSTGTEVGSLSAAAAGSGQLKLTDGSRTLVVEAVVNEEGRGIVRTGPV